MKYATKYATVYCDESGNTGANYIDQQQPLYVLAGWWIHRDNEKDVSDLFQELILNRMNATTEIKGASLVKTNEGQESILEFIREIGQAHCVPLYVVAEKRYCVSAKIIETLLDPVYNPLSSYDFWEDIEIKQDTADIVYQLSDATLGEFAKAYRELEINQMSHALQLICEELNSNSYSTLSGIISGALNSLPAIIDAEVTSGHTIPGKGSNTLNMPVFASYICNIELLSRWTGVDEVTISHDNIPEFQETYDWLFRVYGNGDRVDIPLSNGTIIPIGFQYVKSFTMLDSASSLLIQAADILASSIYSIFSSMYLGKSLTPNQIKIGRILLPATIAEPQCGTMITSKAMNANLGKTFLS